MPDALEPELEMTLEREDRPAHEGLSESELVGAEAYGEWLPEAEIIETRGTWSQVWGRFARTSSRSPASSSSSCW